MRRDQILVEFPKTNNAIAPRSLEKGGDYVKSTLMKAFVETL